MKITELENQPFAINFGTNPESQASPYFADEEWPSFRSFGPMNVNAGGVWPYG